MTWIPTKKQWKAWSLTAKATYASFVLGAVGLIFTGVTFFLSSSSVHNENRQVTYGANSPNVVANKATVNIASATVLLTDAQARDLADRVVAENKSASLVPGFQAQMSYQRAFQGWAAAYNLDPDAAAREVYAWVDSVHTSRSTDKSAQALAEFLSKHYEKSAQLYSDTATEDLAAAMRYKEASSGLVEKQRAAESRAATNLLNAGDAYLSAEAFVPALDRYVRALPLVNGEMDRALRGRLLGSIGLCHERLFALEGSERASEHLRLAVESYRASLTNLTVSRSSHNFALTQSHLGLVLREQAEESVGQDSRRLVSESVAAYVAAKDVTVRSVVPHDWAEITDGYALSLAASAAFEKGQVARMLYESSVDTEHAALEVFTRDKYPQDFARSQNNLGILLMSQGRYLDSIKAFRESLTVVENVTPKDRAERQMNLANTLMLQSKLSEGKSANEMLGESIDLCHLALKVLTRDGFPYDFVKASMDLGDSLREQGNRSVGDAARNSLKGAVSAYRDALAGTSGDKAPAVWSEAHAGLGLALRALGSRSSGEEAKNFLADAAASYREALTVRTPELLGTVWAENQMHLGTALMAEAQFVSQSNGMPLLVEARKAYVESLRVYTRKDYAGSWAEVQRNLGHLSEAEGRWASDYMKLQLMTEAVFHERQSLEVYTRDGSPQDWAAAKSALGWVLKQRAGYLTPEDAKPVLDEAVECFHDAHKVFTREHSLIEWAETEGCLGRTLFQEARVSPSEAVGKKYLEDAIACLRATLEVFTEKESPVMHRIYSDLLNNALDVQKGI